jgi:hypothetical protein
MHRTLISSRTLSIAASALLALGLLVACSSTTNGGATAGPSFDVLVADPEGADPLTLSQVMVDGATLAPSALSEIESGLWFGNTVDATAGSTATVTLPSEGELPGAVRTNVENAFLNAEGAPDCSVQATTASANVTYTLFQLLAAPGLAALTPEEGLAVALMSDSELDVDGSLADGTRIYTWIWADSATDVTFTGSDCDGFDAELRLEAGWNTAAWVVGGGGTTFTLQDVTMPEPITATVISFS